MKCHWARILGQRLLFVCGICFLSLVVEGNEDSATTLSNPQEKEPRLVVEGNEDSAPMLNITEKKEPSPDSINMLLNDVTHTALNTTLNSTTRSITVSCSDLGKSENDRTELGYYVNYKRIYFASFPITPELRSASFSKTMNFNPQSNRTEDKEKVVICVSKDGKKKTATFAVLYESTTVTVVTSTDFFKANETVNIVCIADGNPEPTDFEILHYPVNCKEMDNPLPDKTEETRNTSVMPPACIQCRAKQLLQTTGQKEITSEFVVLDIVGGPKEFPWWAIALIVVFSLIALSLIVILLLYILYKKRNQKAKRNRDKIVAEKSEPEVSAPKHKK